MSIASESAAATAEARSLRSRFFILSLGNFIVGISAFVVFGLMAEMSRAFAVTPDTMARVVAEYSLAYALFAPILVAVTGALPRRLVVTLGMGLTAFAAFLCAIAPALIMIDVGRIIAAFGASLYSPAVSAVAISMAPPEKRATALSAVFMGFTAAQGIGTPMGTWLGYTFGWQVTFVIVGALASLMTAVVWRTVPKDVPFAPTSLVELGRVVRSGPVIAGLAFTLLFMTSTYITLTFITPMLETRLGVGRDGLAAYLMIYGSMAFVASMVSGMIADRVGPSRALFALCVMLSVLHPLMTQGPTQPIAMALIIGAWSLFGWSHFTMQQSRLVSIAPRDAQLVIALNSSTLHLGIAVGAAIASFLIVIPEWRGIAAASTLLVIAAAISLIAGDRWIERRGRG